MGSLGQHWVRLGVVAALIVGCGDDASDRSNGGTAGTMAADVGAGADGAGQPEVSASGGEITPDHMGGQDANPPDDVAGAAMDRVPRTAGDMSAGDSAENETPRGGAAIEGGAPGNDRAMVGGQVGAQGGEEELVDFPAGGQPMGDREAPMADGTMEMPRAESAEANPQAITQFGFSNFTHLIGGGLIGQSANGIVLLDENGRIEFGEAYGRFVDATDIVVEARDAFTITMVLTDTHLLALSDGIMEVSPLSSSLPENTHVGALAAHPADALWLATSAGLYRWAGGSIRRMMEADQEFDWMRTQLVAGQLYGTAVVWGRNDQLVLGVGVTADEPVAWRFETSAPVSAMTTTQHGLWLSDDTSLSVLSTAGSWTTWRRPPHSSVIKGHPAQTTLWLSDGQTLNQWTGDALMTRINAPLHAHIQVDAEGRALLGNVQGVTSVSPGRFALVDGLDDRVTGPTTVTISMSDADMVSSVSVRVDNGAPTALVGPDWTIELSPDEIAPGSHTLHVEVRYSDGGVIETDVEFAGPPGWALDIEPLQQAHCARCHGMGGSAHLMIDAEAWQNEIAAIIDDVETGRMPLNAPALNIEMVELIKDWQAAGFLE